MRISSSNWQENVLVFDLETIRSFDDVGGRNATRQLGMSLAVTYNYRTDSYKTYREDNVKDLIDDLLAADRVIGFNVIRFDYEVLHGYTDHDLTKIRTVDMLLDLEKILGHRISLNALAVATLEAEKSGHGLQAIEWYREGNWADLEKYCRDDVRITRELYDHGAEKRFLLYESRYEQGGVARVDIDCWPCLTGGQSTQRVQGVLF